MPGPVTAEDLQAAVAQILAELKALRLAIAAAGSPSRPPPRRPGVGGL